MYNIDWAIFIRDRIFAVTRQVLSQAWLLVLISPIISIYNELLSYQIRVNRRIKITGQVRILRHWLNELYDPEERRFYIVDVTSTQPLFIFLASENRPVYLPAYTIVSELDFTVIAPEEVSGRIAEIKAFIDTYKLVSKRYTIAFLTDAEIDGGVIFPDPRIQTQ